MSKLGWMHEKSNKVYVPFHFTYDLMIFSIFNLLRNLLTCIIAWIITYFVSYAFLCLSHFLLSKKYEKDGCHFAPKKKKKKVIDHDSCFV